MGGQGQEYSGNIKIGRVRGTGIFREYSEKVVAGRGGQVGIFREYSDMVSVCGEIFGEYSEKWLNKYWLNIKKSNIQRMRLAKGGK